MKFVITNLLIIQNVCKETDYKVLTICIRNTDDIIKLINTNCFENNYYKDGNNIIITLYLEKPLKIIDDIDTNIRYNFELSYKTPDFCKILKIEEYSNNKSYNNNDVDYDIATPLSDEKLELKIELKRNIISYKNKLMNRMIIIKDYLRRLHIENIDLNEVDDIHNEFERFMEI